MDENPGKAEVAVTGRIGRSWATAAKNRKRTKNAKQVSHSLRQFHIRDFLSIFTKTNESTFLSAKHAPLAKFLKDSWNSEKPFAPSAISECPL